MCTLVVLLSVSGVIGGAVVTPRAVSRIPGLLVIASDIGRRSRCNVEYRRAEGDQYPL